jgi:hypothetical protein
MTPVVIGAISAVYLFAGITSWLITALEMLGHTDNPYLVWLRDASKKNLVLEGASVGYLVLLWPVHLALKSVFKK